MFEFRIDRADGEELHPALLHTLTRLYVLKPSHSPDEERHFTELALRLIDVVDEAERVAVAERLMLYGRAPHAVLRRLADRLADADPAAGDSEPFESAPPEPAPAPAEPDELSELFFAADAAERRLVLEMLEHAPIAPMQPLHQIHANDAARRLEAAALSRSRFEFAMILTGTLGVGRTLAMRIANDPCGEPLIAAMRALDLPRDVAERIVLFLNPEIGENVTRVYDLMLLYRDLAPGAARRLVSIWRKTSIVHPLRHQPIHYDDDRHHPRTEAARGTQRQSSVSARRSAG